MAVQLLSNMVKVSSSYLNQIEGRALTVMTLFSSRVGQARKVLNTTGPTCEPMATPYICLRNQCVIILQQTLTLYFKREYEACKGRFNIGEQRNNV